MIGSDDLHGFDRKVSFDTNKGYPSSPKQTLPDIDPLQKIRNRLERRQNWVGDAKVQKLKSQSRESAGDARES